MHKHGGLSLGLHQLRVDVCLNNEPGFTQPIILEPVLGFASIITARASHSFNKCQVKLLQASKL